MQNFWNRRNIDVSLVLPHYRAHNQPFDHRLSMYAGTDSDAPIKVKVVRVAAAPLPSSVHHTY